MRTLNAKCPKCGEEELKATIQAFYKNVPLYADGYDHSEGLLQEDEILAIKCSKCGAVVSLNHYYT